MSYSRWEFMNSNQSRLDHYYLNPAPHEPVPRAHAADMAIDAALRNVPLPDGLFTRLSALAYAVPDDAADQIDWLGC
jgi:hypothetical protein